MSGNTSQSNLNVFISYFPHAKGATDAKSFIWTAVAERSRDTAFASHEVARMRRGASLPAAVQDDLLVA
jgi:hypothetical protein